jgi:anthranilate phosphoribosyltransferase
MTRSSVTELTVKNAHDSLAVIKAIFAGEHGPARNIVVLNAGAAIYAADLADSLQQGIERAASVIDSGAASEKLNALIVNSQAKSL